MFSGHYCPTGSHEELRCDSGTYQDETAQDTCKTCPAGFFCDNTLSPVVLYNDTLCPEGKTSVRICNISLGSTLS